MSLFELVSISSSPALIAGICILLQAWCLLTEVKDHKGFYLAGTLLAQFALPVLFVWLLQKKAISPQICGILLESAYPLTAAGGVLTAFYILIVNRHRIPDLTVYAAWSVLFAAGTYLIQIAAYGAY